MILRLFGVCILLLLTVVSAVAQGTFLFEANFDNNDLSESLNIQYGTHEIVDGALSYSVTNGGFLLIPEGIDWTDYAIETRLRILSGSVWVQSRTGTDLCSGYYLTLNPSNGSTDLSSSDRSCNFTVFEELATANLSDEWLVARIEVIGDQITASIDREMVFTATDAQFTSGYPTINVFPTDDTEARIEFDYIHVIDLSDAPVIEETPTPPIETPIPEESDEAIDLPSVNEIPLGDTPEETIASLQSLELIPSSSGQHYTESVVNISRIGAWFEPLFEDVSSNHVVMSGNIHFLPYNDGEACLLSARISRDEVGVAQRYLDVGINSRNEIFVGETNDSGDYSQATQEGLMTQPEGNILFIAYGNQVSVYLNGRAVFQNIDVTPRTGGIGISSIASTSFSICQVRDIWAYTFED